MYKQLHSLSIQNPKISLGQCLIQIKGISYKKACFICFQTGLLFTTPINLLTKQQLSDLVTWIQSHFSSTQPVGSDFIKAKQTHTSFLKKLPLESSIRKNLGLPVRGQRTHSNAKTCKKLKW